ncbi:hypothetical protein EJ02DRAFT_199742 [Clathrospora elynae]|uniref:Uncharacterized protein n=1 Tax=Clathrospora elynae TaxID=706981 RepID=A0A6A5T1S4_9PLEO|nr:hypothetical protein EJ02DRAFT_199742 [Clathrospora elynae]
MRSRGTLGGAMPNCLVFATQTLLYDQGIPPYSSCHRPEPTGCMCLRAREAIRGGMSDVMVWKQDCSVASAAEQASSASTHRVATWSGRRIGFFEISLESVMVSTCQPVTAVRFCESCHFGFGSETLRSMLLVIPGRYPRVGEKPQPRVQDSLQRPV